MTLLQAAQSARKMANDPAPVIEFLEALPKGTRLTTAIAELKKVRVNRELEVVVDIDDLKRLKG